MLEEERGKNQLYHWENTPPHQNTRAISEKKSKNSIFTTKHPVLPVSDRTAIIFFKRTLAEQGVCQTNSQ